MVEGSDGKERLYKAYKLPAHTVAVEGFKLLKAILPSLGSGIDSISQDTEEMALFGERSTTWTAAFQLLESNLTSEHFEDLVSKMFGSLMYVSDPITEEHFDEYIEDYLEVLVWLFKENFSMLFSR